jgi:hypothetical protein
MVCCTQLIASLRCLRLKQLPVDNYNQSRYSLPRVHESLIVVSCINYTLHPEKDRKIKRICNRMAKFCLKDCFR